MSKQAARYVRHLWRMAWVRLGLYLPPGNIFLLYLRCIDIREYASSEWARIVPEDDLRARYDLSPSSHVMDLGGFRGDWTALIVERYGCQVDVFEPVPQFARRLQERFAGNGKVKVHPFGIAGSTRVARMTVDDDSSSIVGTGPGPEVSLVQLAEFLQHEGIATVDLMKINIEGAEFEVLDHMIEAGIVTRVRDIQVQFHAVVANAAERMVDIQRRLSATHRRTFQYPWTWENWRLKSAGRANDSRL